MELLLRLSRAVDALSARIGVLANALVLIAVLLSASHAFLLSAFDTGSNAWREAQLFCFAGMVMLGAAWTLQRNEHVRIDLLYGRLSPRTQAWIDVLGGLFFLLPMAGLMAWLSWRMFAPAFVSGETSGDAGGFAIWPMLLLFPLGFALLVAQGCSEIVKRIAYLRGHPAYISRYERPRQ
jgi:TRAP-type mannitol/chloroaromatic compound transport system permease small subunit